MQAVRGIHELKIVHSDLKPANFLLVQVGGVCGRWTWGCEHSVDGICHSHVPRMHNCAVKPAPAAALVPAETTVPPYPSPLSCRVGSPHLLVPLLPSPASDAGPTETY